MGAACLAVATLLLSLCASLAVATGATSSRLVATRDARRERPAGVARCRGGAARRPGNGQSYRVRVKVAFTVRTSFIETAQMASVPLQAPVHPAKTEPFFGVAVSVTSAPAA